MNVQIIYVYTDTFIYDIILIILSVIGGRMKYIIYVCQVRNCFICNSMDFSMPCNILESLSVHS